MWRKKIRKHHQYTKPVPKSKVVRKNIRYNEIVFCSLSLLVIGTISLMWLTPLAHVASYYYKLEGTQVGCGSFT